MEHHKNNNWLDFAGLWNITANDLTLDSKNISSHIKSLGIMVVEKTDDKYLYNIKQTINNTTINRIAVVNPIYKSIGKINNYELSVIGPLNAIKIKDNVVNVTFIPTKRNKDGYPTEMRSNGFSSNTKNGSKEYGIGYGFAKKIN